MTERMYYKDPYLKEAEATIVEVREEGEKVAIKLDKTIFYPEGGGQPGDRGKIIGEQFEVLVENTIEKADGIWHIGSLKGEIPEKGEKVKLQLDWDWRYENMRTHTGQHILSAILKKLYDLDTSGFQIFEDHAKIEVNGEVTWEMIENVEIEANNIVLQDVPVTIEEYKYLPDDIARILRKHVTKVKDKIRIVKIGDIDVTPCGGTHVKSTREVGLIKVIRFYKKSKGTWRIEFVCGKRAIKKLNEILRDYWTSLDLMPNKNPPLSERVREVLKSIDELEEKFDSQRKELWKWKEQALLGRSWEVGHYNVVTFVEEWEMKDAQAFAVDFVKNNPGTIVILASNDYVIFARNEEVPVSMKELLQKVIDELGGKGGGTDNLARGKIEAEPEDIIDVALEKLKEMLET
ncbi:DHHA1 domain-containing protein [Pyrococcus sp. ST04]|uniref:alanyl-tRNA editing protein n=1 Tax=Pyrococcus sp. ST04 TaxID=1183377 RepID=UPI0002605A03|nr:DHHA1 domain-containing protein [Pyrococcus sp. ST04]AFK21940.1 alanyl-tRNA synthetase [Pyrococcus sp. ST04]